MASSAEGGILRRLPQNVQGQVDSAFGAVAEAFADNVREPKDLGAAVAVYLDGRKVVDLWGGLRDGPRGIPWEEDTLVPVFSVTKGVAAACVALAVSRGRLDYDAPVARYWPEFAVNGKAEITITQIVSHRAGLAALDVRLTADDLADLDRLAEILAAQKPRWEPGSRPGYHLSSFGLYANEIMRRSDFGGRTIGQYFAQEIAAPLGLEFHLGLPKSIPQDRIALLQAPRLKQTLKGLRLLPGGTLGKLLNPVSYLHGALRDVRGFDPNQRQWLEIEFASGNGVGDARSLAKLYGDLALGGTGVGLRPDIFQRLCAAEHKPAKGERDAVLGVPLSWGLGFMKPEPLFSFGASERAFGMPGLGGSFAFADPDRRLGYAYVMNRLGVLPFDEPRELAVRQALYRCLG